MTSFESRATTGLRTSVYGGDGNDFFDFSFAARNAGATSPEALSVFERAYGAGQHLRVRQRFEMRTALRPYFIDLGELSEPPVGFGGLSIMLLTSKGLTLTTGNAVPTPSGEVESTNAGTPIYLNSANGNDTVNVGDDLGTQDIAADVQVQNTPVLTALNIDDSLDLTARSPVIDISNGFGYVASLSSHPASIFWYDPDINCDQFQHGSMGADSVTVSNLAVPLSLNSVRRRADTVTLGNGSNGMQGISCECDCSGDSPAFNTVSLVLNDTADGGAPKRSRQNSTLRSAGPELRCHQRVLPRHRRPSLTSGMKWHLSR